MTRCQGECARKLEYVKCDPTIPMEVYGCEQGTTANRAFQSDKVKTKRNLFKLLLKLSTPEQPGWVKTSSMCFCSHLPDVRDSGRVPVARRCKTRLKCVI